MFVFETKSLLERETVKHKAKLSNYVDSLLLPLELPLQKFITLAKLKYSI